MADQDKIYEGQPLQLVLDTNETMTAVASPKIDLTWPDGTVTSESASATETTKLATNIIKDRLVPGSYKAQAMPDFGAGTVPGATVMFKVFAKGT